MMGSIERYVHKKLRGTTTEFFVTSIILYAVTTLLFMIGLTVVYLLASWIVGVL